MNTKHEYTTTEPVLGLESKVKYFYDSNFGVSMLVNNSSNIESKILGFPNDNNTSVARITYVGIGIPFFYVWGDKGLGKNGMAFRFGTGPQVVYFNPINLNSGEKSETLSGLYNGISFLFSFFLDQFMLEYSTASMIVPFNKFETKYKETGTMRPAKLRVRLNSATIAYQYFF